MRGIPAATTMNNERSHQSKIYYEPYRSRENRPDGYEIIGYDYLFDGIDERSMVRLIYHLCNYKKEFR